MPAARAADKEKHLHLSLFHDLDNLQLTLGNLNDLFDETSTNLLLELVDPTELC